MRVVRERPPIYDEIVAAFPDASGPGVIFAWGDTIFNPSATDIGRALMAHEAVHGQRQGADVRGWWRKYLADPQFRLDEEVPAHVAELRVIRSTLTTRHARKDALRAIAARLASPLYGGLISPRDAEKLLRAAVFHGES